MSAALGLGTELDPETIRISRHALERYVERRHAASYFGAEAKLRELLGRCGNQRPPVMVHKGSPSRRYTAGGFAFIVAADHGALITFYPWSEARKASHGGGRKARHGAPRRRDWSYDEEDVA